MVRKRIVFWSDLAGTAVFAIEGASAAFHAGLDLLGVLVLSFVAALGGGVMRDVLLARVPMVLVANIYASAALLGAAVVVMGRRLGWPPTMAATLGGIVCFGVRIGAVHFNWQLPTAL